MAGTVAERATRAHEEASPLAAGRPQALNEDLKRLRGGLPNGQAGGVRHCNRPSVRQGLREQGGRRSAAERVGAPRELTAIRSGPCQCPSVRMDRASSEGTRIGIKRPGARLWAGDWALARLGWCCRRRGPQKERGGTGPRTFGGAGVRLCGLEDWAGKVPSGPPTLLFSYGSIYLSHKCAYVARPERKTASKLHFEGSPRRAWNGGTAALIPCRFTRRFPA
jgi:hypothetical protein